MPVSTRSHLGATSVTFEFADPSAAFSAVRLWQEVRIPGDRLDFVREGNSWVLTLDRPPVSRMEYLFEVTDLPVTAQ